MEISPPKKNDISYISHLASPKAGIIVDITPEEYALCEAASFNMGCNNKKTRYGRGMINTDDDPRKVERIGRLGETAVARILNLKVDWSYRKYGDMYDFTIPVNNIKIDVKTTAPRKYFPDKGFIRSEDGNGKLVALKSDVFIFCYVRQENTELKTAKIEIYGWISKKQILRLPKIKTPRKDSRHTNYEIDFSTLNSIIDLVYLLKHNLLKLH
jgi:hypothetical protein